MIDRQTIDRIYDAANIVDVVSDYVTLRRSGTSYKGLCPFHDDKTPSFYVNPVRGICKCFSCGKGGNAVGFIMEIEQMTYPEALRHLAKKFGVEVKEEELTEEEKKERGAREQMLAANNWAADYFHNNLLNTPDGKAIGMAYFRNRGFRDDTIEKFRLGYALDSWDALSKEAKKKGFKDDVLVATSLAYKKDDGRLTDKFRGRVMFPWFSLSGQVLAFGGRVLDARTKGVNQKYINSNDSEIYHKLKELYGLYQAKQQIAKEQQVYMVEGYTDVISMHQCGITNVVANSGTALNDAQIFLLKRFTNNITLIYDSDEAGIHAAIRGTDMLLAQGMNVKVLLLPEGDDPDSFARSHSAQEFRDYVAKNQTDFIIFKANHLLREAQNDPRKRAELTESILQSISVIPEEITRSAYIHECAELMNMDEQMLMRRSVDIRKNIREQKQKEKEREQQRQEYLDRQKNGTEGATQPEGTNPAPDTTTNGGQQPDMPSAGGQQPAPAGAPVPTQQPAPSYPDAATLARDKETAKIMGTEALIMQMVVRYGEKLLPVEDAEGQPKSVPVAVVVKHELEIDGMQFLNQRYAAMLDDAIAHIDEEGFTCSRYFLTCPDLEVNRIATEMLNDRYHLDKTFEMEPEENTLSTKIPRLIMDYKFYVVQKEMQTLKRQLADKSVTANPQQLMEVMTRYKFLTDIQTRIAKQLGERIVAV